MHDSLACRVKCNTFGGPDGENAYSINATILVTSHAKTGRTI